MSASKLSFHDFGELENDSFIGDYSSIYIPLSPLLEFFLYYYAKAFRHSGPQRSYIKSSERKMVYNIDIEVVFP